MTIYIVQKLIYVGFYSLLQADESTSKVLIDEYSHFKSQVSTNSLLNSVYSYRKGNFSI